MTQYEAVRATLLNRCRAIGYLSLEAILHVVDGSLQPATSEERQRKTLALIRDLIDRHDLIAGNFRGRRFVRWKRPLKCTLDLIAHEWGALGRHPTFFDVVCLMDPDQPH